MTPIAPQDVAPRVLAVVARTQRLPAEKVTLDSTFEELGIDSLDGFNLLFALEEEFDLSFPDDAARGIADLRELVAALDRELASRTGEPPAATG